MHVKHLGRNSCSMHTAFFSFWAKTDNTDSQVQRRFFAFYPCPLASFNHLIFTSIRTIENISPSSRNLLCYQEDLWVQLRQPLPHQGWALCPWGEVLGGTFFADLKISSYPQSTHYGPRTTSSTEVHFLTSSSEQTWEVDTVDISISEKKLSLTEGQPLC